jgi:hypothetical protein
MVTRRRLESWWSLGGAFFVVAACTVIIGLRASIVVRPSRVVFTRKWFFIPYWRNTGRVIEDVWFGATGASQNALQGWS